MKTSNKLLIVLLICLPISLVAYNVLLKKELLAGNFEQRDERNSRDEYYTTTVAPFKYLVIDGSMVSGDTVTKTDYKKNTDWHPTIGIKLLPAGTDKKANTLKIVSPYRDVLKYNLSNDTLYVSFYKNKAAEQQAYYSYYYGSENLLDRRKMLEIQATQLLTVKSKYAGVAIDGIGAKVIDTLHITSAADGIVDVNNLVVKKLGVTVKGNSKLSIYDNNRIDTMRCAVLQRGTFNVEAKSVKKVYDAGTDVHARMSISGEVGDVRKLLN